MYISFGYYKNTNLFRRKKPKTQKEGHCPSSVTNQPTNQPNILMPRYFYAFLFSYISYGYGTHLAELPS